jgi:DNA-binding MarR family transcriptional regulator
MKSFNFRHYDPEAFFAAIKLARQAQQDYGLLKSRHASQILYVAHQLGPISVSDIASLTGIHACDVSRTVTSLQNAQWLSRTAVLGRPLVCAIAIPKRSRPIDDG